MFGPQFDGRVCSYIDDIYKRSKQESAWGFAFHSTFYILHFTFNKCMVSPEFGSHFQWFANRFCPAFND